jgi:hypothetical protein
MKHLGISPWVPFAVVLAIRCYSNEQQPGPVRAAETDKRSTLDERALLAHGFELDTARYTTCSISGSGGPCDVEAFVWGETSKDSLAHTCAKLNKATYTGTCVEGALDGVALVIADGTGKVSKEAFVAYFSKGKIAYPALTSYVSASSEQLNLGARERRRSYGCVYFGGWDRSDERAGCRHLRKAFGDDIFSEANARALREDSFDLAKYRSRFMAFVSKPD